MSTDVPVDPAVATYVSRHEQRNADKSSGSGGCSVRLLVLYLASIFRDLGLGDVERPLTVS